MRRTRGAFALLLCLTLLLCLAPLAWAADETAYEGIAYDEGVIVGFENAGALPVVTVHVLGEFELPPMPELEAAPRIATPATTASASWRFWTWA